MRYAKSIYSSVSACLRVNTLTTDWFSVNPGVRQGCCISPFLFNLFINDLALKIKSLGGLNPAKATGLDGIGPRILKLASTVLSPSITALINKSIETATFPDQLKWPNCTLFIKGAQNLIQ